MAGKKIKCLVWDLDDTLWEGALLEGGAGALRPGAAELLRTLDARGILLSVASKNEPEDARAALRRFGLEEYFLAPRIGWGSKADSIEDIARELNLGLDSFAFIDDQPAEREEVRFHHPEVRVYGADTLDTLAALPEFTPRFVTEDARRRRALYRADLARREEEREFSGSSEAFLETLCMRLTLAPVREGDLERAEELTLRTNQLNSTGITYDYDTLRGFIGSPSHLFLTAELADRFGEYGKIGLVLAERTEGALVIRLLLLSCRVMTRGIGSALLVYLTRAAAGEGRTLLADFISTGRNRVMYITYKLMGFEEASREGDRVLLRYGGAAREYPDYLEIAAD